MLLSLSLYDNSAKNKFYTEKYVFEGALSFKRLNKQIQYFIQKPVPDEDLVRYRTW